jgi:hypothetical protein
MDGAWCIAVIDHWQREFVSTAVSLLKKSENTKDYSVLIAWRHEGMLGVVLAPMCRCCFGG